MLKPLLIEIGVEELPAIPFLKELPNIEKRWSDILEENALLDEFDFFYTPRRLILWHPSFKVKQDDSEEEFFGAPMAIAFKDGEPTGAALGFAKKCGVSIDEIGRAEKGGKEVLHFKKAVEGKASAQLLQEMVEKFIFSLSFGKSMRWGSNNKSFIRPIRWFSAMLGEENLGLKLFNLDSEPFTHVHRQNSFDKKPYSDAKEFFDILEAGDVDIFAQSREKLILEQFKTIEKESGIEIEVDEELLAEIVAITEHPVSLLGSFDEAFLELPNEVIITSMREHQRYFPVFKNGKLSNAFIVVSNAVCDDYSLITQGNEKVLHARLSDGLFFYKNDLKTGLVSTGLKNVTYMKGLGSLEEKIVREKAIAFNLYNTYKDQINSDINSSDENTQKLLNRIFEVSKSDLLSEMVYEFTELQGLMGYYYANILGEDSLVAKAIRDQYLPLGEDEAMPENSFSAIVSLSVKLDALMGMFSIDQIPTGSRDPFALRRAVTGIIRIALDNKLPLNLATVFNDSSSLYADFDMSKLDSFFLERLNTFYSANNSIIKAVVSTGERNLLELDKKIKAVANIAQSEGFKELSSLFKRVANITDDMKLDSDLNVDKDILEIEEEKVLFEAFEAVNAKEYSDYEQKFDALVGLAKPLANFFDNVMVNADDEKLKTNRKNLVASIYKAFKSIADIKEITL